MVKDKEKQKYEQTFSEFNKWRSLIRSVVGRNIIVLSKQNLSEYGKL